MRKIKYLIASTLLLSFIASSCNKNKVEPTPALYWKKTFYMGNLKINNVDIPTYSDVSTADKVADYVKIANLSDEPMETISINLFIPTDTSLYSITMSEEAVAIVSSSSVTTQISHSSFKYNNLIDSLQYAVFELTATCTPMSKDDFSNIKFTAKFDYKGEDGKEESRAVESNIFKKN